MALLGVTCVTFEESEFTALLNDSGVAYSIKPPLYGGPTNCAGMRLLIDTALSASIPGLIALVLIKWLEKDSKRRVFITTSKGKTEHIYEGMTASEVTEIIRASRSIIISDTKGREPDANAE